MATKPVEKKLTLPADPETTFRRFTEEIDAWWPRDTHSVGREACASVRMEGRVGGRVYEVSEDGEETEWGRVRIWEPPERVAFTWHPGRAAETAQEVEVRFEAVEGGTELHLVHRGWDALGDRGAEVRDDYDGGWDTVLGRYADSVAAPAG